MPVITIHLEKELFDNLRAQKGTKKSWKQYLILDNIKPGVI